MRSIDSYVYMCLYTYDFNVYVCLYLFVGEYFSKGKLLSAKLERRIDWDRRVTDRGTRKQSLVLDPNINMASEKEQDPMQEEIREKTNLEWWVVIITSKQHFYSHEL